MTTTILIIMVLGVIVTIFSWYTTRNNLKRLAEMKREFENHQHIEDDKTKD